VLAALQVLLWKVYISVQASENMMSTTANEFQEFLLSVWVELVFMSVFAISFALIRFGVGKKPKVRAPQLFRQVQTEAASGKAAAALSAWRAVQSQQLTPCETLRLVVQAFVDSAPSSLIVEVVDHLACHASDLLVSKAAVAALEVVARSGDEAMMEELFQAYVRRLRIPTSMHMQEVLLGGYASAANEAKAMKLVGQLRESRQKVTVRGYSMLVKGFLKNRMLDAALLQIEAMRNQKLALPVSAIPELFQVARELGRTAEVFKLIVEKEVTLTIGVLAQLLEDCLKSQDANLARSLDQFAQQSKMQLNFSACEALLKVYVSVGDNRAIEIFAELQQRFPQISEGLCVGLIVRCAEPKFLRFAEELVSYLRAHGRMSIIIYSALMKVYSHCNMYNEACNLYDQIKVEGLEPDSMMYGCLMRFSAECGRTDLTRELSAMVPSSKLGLPHYMSLIRAAGHDKDVDKAFTILDGLRSMGVFDTAIYNAILDVCSSAGEMNRARELSSEMKRQGLMDIISYNTLLKGYCMQSDSKSATAIMADMEVAGLQPNDVSYNCLINLAASAGDFSAAWKTIETMERRGIRIDHYSVSTLMKALKRAPTGKDVVRRVLDLLDRHDIDVCREEVLLNTALEACMKHGEHRRLESLLKGMESVGSMQLSPHTYASLIKAAGMLKRVQRCRDLWNEMTEMRRIEPTGVALGCMLDALVCNGGVKEGVALMRKWQGRVQVNTILYSTLIKGFTTIHDTKGAVEMWQELRAQKLPMNTMVYNAIIDVHARVGATDEVSKLLKSMKEDEVQPDDITKSIVAKGYCFTGELDKAMEVFRTLLLAKPSSNTVIVYNTILDGCVRHNRLELADDLVANMQAYRIEPSNFTLGIIVKMWGRRRQLAEAFKAYRTLPKKYGFTPNGPVRTCLFFACLRNDSVSSALEVFDELRTSGHPLDSKIYSALINRCARDGLLERAVSFVEEAYGLMPGSKRVLPYGDQLEAQCMDQLMKSLTKQGRYQNLGAALMKKMRQANVPFKSQDFP
jgi:pentatricopeptide repeat protein